MSSKKEQIINKLSVTNKRIEKSNNHLKDAEDIRDFVKKNYPGMRVSIQQREERKLMREWHSDNTHNTLYDFLETKKGISDDDLYSGIL